MPITVILLAVTRLLGIESAILNAVEIFNGMYVEGYSLVDLNTVSSKLLADFIKPIDSPDKTGYCKRGIPSAKLFCMTKLEKLFAFGDEWRERFSWIKLFDYLWKVFLYSWVVVSAANSFAYINPTLSIFPISAMLADTFVEKFFCPSFIEPYDLVWAAWVRKGVFGGELVKSQSNFSYTFFGWGLVVSHTVFLTLNQLLYSL